MRRITLKLMALCLTSSITPSATPSATSFLIAANAAQAMNLLPRTSPSCVSDNYFPCSQMPEGFCCPANFDCLVFNNALSVLCCPSGQDCSKIEPISCDIQQANATLYPWNELHSISLEGSLGICSDKCCPRGYTCQSNQCILKETTLPSTISISSSPTASSTTTLSSSPSTSTSTSTSTPTASSTTTLSSSSSTSTFTSTASPTTSLTKSNSLTTSSLALPSSTEAPREISTLKPSLIPTNLHCDKFPVAAILVGVIPGIAIGVLFTILAIICIGRHRASQRASSETTTVSDPIYQPQNIAFRTDFLRRGSRSKAHTPCQTSRVRSLFAKTPMIRSSDAFPYAGVKTPVRYSVSTPVRSPEMRREPSMESIKIYSPPNEDGIYSWPNGGLERPTTTFTDMMADAVFRPGETYVDMPGRLHLRR